MKKQLLFWWAPLILLSLFAYFIQTNIYLHKDVGILVHTAKLMLQGETYTRNIFEPNPPMIFYLYMPGIILSNLTKISMLDSLRIYFIGLTLVSISCSYYLLKKLFHDNNIVIYMLAYILIFILLFLPAHQFAQREHFLMLFSIPYLFAAGLRLENKAINPYLAIVCGWMAGIGFSIKPHFLAALLFIELYFIFKKRHLLGWIRIESVIVLTILSTYIATIFIFYPEYLHKVLPLWMPYYQLIKQPWTQVLFYEGFVFCITIILFYFMMCKIDRYPNISTILLLALIGFICSYIAPRVAWYYHILPALGMACLLAGLIFSQIIHLLPKKISGTIMLAILAIIIFFTPCFLYIHSIKKYTSDFAAEDSQKKLVSFLNNYYPDNNFDIFSMNHNLTILEYYANAKYVGIFQYFVWEYNTLALKESPSRSAVYYQLNYTPYCINSISNNLADKKPRFIIVDIPSSESYIHMKVDYIKKYSQYKIFREAWASYRYLTSIDQYQIYERNNNT